MAIATVRDLVKRYAQKAVVDRVSFDVEAGETLVVLGPSGSGKSTTLRMIAGLETPEEGRIELAGTVVNDPAPRVAPERRGLSMVFQNLALWPHLTAAENIEFPLRCRGVSRAERSRRAAEVLALVDLPDRGKSAPSQLSGGERQRVALARALVVEPRILLMDEPLSDLDPELAAGLVEKIGELTKTLDITMIYVTHDQEEAMSLATRVLVMNHGRIEQIAPARELFEAPASRFVASFVGYPNLLDGTMRSDGAVDTPIGTVRVRAATTAGAGQDAGRAVTVALRADALRLHTAADAASAADARDVRVERGHFRGDRWIYSVRSDELTLTGVSRVPIETGRSARLVVEHDAALLPESAAEGAA